MDRLQAMRVFMRVAEAGSFIHAAGTLHLPRATVSAAVQQLEARLGVRLLHRTTRKVSLTVDGAACYERCQRLLEDFDEIESLFRESAARPRGRLRVNVPGRVARKLIIPALADFIRRYPDVELELGVSDRPVDLVEEGVDCAVRVGGLPDSSLIARQIGELRFGSYASPDYLARHGTPQRPDDLPRHWAVNYASPLTGQVHPWEYVDGNRVRRLPMRSRVTVNDAEAYIACACAGLGLIQVPAYDTRDERRRGRLVEVLADWPPASEPISVIYPHRRHLSKRVQTFVEWLSHLFREKVRKQ